MARNVIDPPAMSRTSFETNDLLLERMGVHVKKNKDTQNNFLTRAIINQMEREGDFSIRHEMEELAHG